MDRFIKPPTDSMKKLDALADELRRRRYNQLGYPFDQETSLSGFYQWLVDTKLCDLTLINVGDPYKTEWDMLHTDEFERACIDFLATAYGFGDDHWGVISNGGTDGNMYGVYFGRKALSAKSARSPILYVSDEAHYSVKKLGDIQNIETRTISAYENGQMDVADFERKLDPTRPALVAIAIGGTFKGAIDNQKEIDAVLKKANPPAVYRHLDAALFGGYLPFLDDPQAREILDAEKMGFDSVAVSGHKFFGLNEPAGGFICRKETLSHMQNNPVPYLNGVIPTIACSRSGFDALKLYWRISTTGIDGYKAQAKAVLENTEYFRKALEKRGVKTWVNKFSNTVIFPRPSDNAVHKYALACNEDKFWGSLSHVVVMQYFTPDLCDSIAEDIATLK